MTSFLTTRRAFIAVVAIGLFAMAARNVTDPDVWWHLRTGHLILQNHGVFHTDPYSFTKFGQPWVNHEWLSGVLIFGIYRLAGWGGLIVTFAAITSVTFMLVFLRCEGGTYLAAAFAVWAATASAPAWGVRPQTLSLFLASLFLFLLERSYARPKLLWHTLPLTLVWVNLHAGFAVGIAFMVLFLAGDILDIALGCGRWSQFQVRLRKLSIAIVACLVVVPFNPYGMRMYWYPLRTVYSKSIEGYISEWSSPNFHQNMYLPALLMLLAILVAVATSPLRLRGRELLLLSVTSWAALHSARHIPLFALVSAPILSNLVRAWSKENWNCFDAVGNQLLPLSWRQLLNGIVLATFLLFGGFRVSHVIKAQPEVEKRSFPLSAISFLRENRLPAPLFNSYNWGGYLIWKLYPEYRVYVDGRADLYGDKFLDQFAGTYEISNPSWQVPMGEWGIRTVLLPPDAPLASALRLTPSWKEVYADSQAVIFSKTNHQANE
jgi:hypothetical protein